MARPIWKGNLSFGLVNIPVALQTASRRQELHFTLLDRRNKARIRYQRVNSESGQQVPWEEIVKGYEYEKGNFVVLSDKDFKNAAVESTQTIDITDFVDRDEIDQMYYDQPYYLVPEKSGEKGYLLLKEIMERTNKVAIGRVVIRTREHLVAVFPHENVLVLNLMRFDHEIVKAKDMAVPGRSSKLKVSERELEMGEQLVESMSGHWKPEKYRDEYYDKLMGYIEKKAKAGDTEIPPQEVPRKKERGVSLEDLLRKSVARSGIKPHGRGRTARPRRTARRRTRSR